MHPASFSFQQTGSKNSDSKSQNAEEQHSIQKQSHVYEEEETYLLMKSKKSTSKASQEFFTKLEPCKIDPTPMLSHPPPTPKARPPGPKTSPTIPSSTSEPPSNKPPPQAPTATLQRSSSEHQSDNINISTYSLQLSSIACMLTNKHASIRSLSKNDRQSTLDRLINEEKDYKIWLKKAKEGNVSKDDVKVAIAKKGPRREQIDALEWLLFPKKAKGQAIASALVAGIQISIRNVLNFYKENFDSNLPATIPAKTPPADTKANSLDDLDKTVNCLQNKEKEWSQWFMFNVLSSSHVGDQQVTQGILEQSLDHQLKRKQKIQSMVAEIKKLKTELNSKVVSVKKTKAN